MRNIIQYTPIYIKTSQNSFLLCNAFQINWFVKIWLTRVNVFFLKSNFYLNYFFVIGEFFVSTIFILWEITFFQKVIQLFIFFIQKHFKQKVTDLVPVKIYFFSNKNFYQKRISIFENFIFLFQKKTKNLDRLLCNFIVYNLEKTKKHQNFLNTLVSYLEKSLISSNVSMLTIKVKGRIGGVDKKTKFIYNFKSSTQLYESKTTFFKSANAFSGNLGITIQVSNG